MRLPIRPRLFLRRIWLGLRARLKARELTALCDRTQRIRGGDILLFATLRNEYPRLEYFLAYYRRLGVGHFLIVDNGSADGGAALLARQPDVSLWRSTASYRRSRYGIDWINALLRRHGSGHWVLVVDPDEFLVFPHCETRPLAALTDWLDHVGLPSLGAMLIDLYPRGRIDAAHCPPGADPIAATGWFDPGNYLVSRNPDYLNLWIQGGPRARVFFPDDPCRAPSLNKVPLVRWRRGYAYEHSTHMLLPRRLNLVYDTTGGERITGALLHAKLMDSLPAKAAEELRRGEHYGGGVEYRAYHRRLPEVPVVWGEASQRYRGWRQLDDLGLISSGGWA